MVVTPATKPWFQVHRGRYGTLPNAYHEDLLNNTLPWIWIMPVQHFEGAFPVGYTWTGSGLKGPYQMYMCVKKAPTPDELMSTPKEDFQKID